MFEKDLTFNLTFKKPYSLGGKREDCWQLHINLTLLHASLPAFVLNDLFANVWTYEQTGKRQIVIEHTRIFNYIIRLIVTQALR